MLKSVASQEEQERQARQAIHDGQKAQEMLDNPLHILYMQHTQQSLFEQFGKLDYKDTDGMQRLHSELKAQQRHQRNYENAAKAGRVGLTILERLAQKIKRERL